MLDIRTISPTTDEGEESTFEVSFLPKGKQPEYNEQGK